MESTLIDKSSFSDETEEDSAIKEYVINFQKEVSKKFSESTTNYNYKYPKQLQKKEKTTEPNSFDSLQEVSLYDLDAQNVKRELLENTKTEKLSESSLLVDAIKKMSKLDKKYLKSQLSSINSPLFKILSGTINKKLRKSKETVVSEKSAKNDFKIKNKLVFHKSFNKLKNLQNGSNTKLKDLNSTRNVKKSKDSKKNRNKGNIVLNKPITMAISPKNKVNVYISEKRKNASLKQKNSVQRNNTKESYKRKKKISVIMNKIKSKTVSKEKSVSRLNSYRNNKPVLKKPSPKGLIKKHATLTKGQLNSLINRNIYHKTKNRVKGEQSRDKSSVRKSNKRKNTSARHKENVKLTTRPVHLGNFY